MLVVVAIVLCIVGYFIWDHIQHKDSLPTENRAVFITGCDSGFGRALVEHLDSVGCHVVAGCFTDKGQKELQDGAFKNVSAVHIDVKDTASIDSAYDQVKSILNGKELWGVVSNAGVSGTAGPIEFVSRKDLLDTFNVNMAGMAEVARVFLPLLKESRGRLVNMVSIAGRFGVQDMGVYVASKYAMEGYSDCQRRELAPWGISVSILNPGLFNTNILSGTSYATAKQAQFDALGDDIKETFGHDYVERAVRYANRLKVGGSSDLHKVTDAYTHALFAKNPRLRYICGNDAKVLWLLSLLPGQVYDFLTKNTRTFARRAVHPKIPVCHS